MNKTKFTMSVLGLMALACSFCMSCYPRDIQDQKVSESDNINNDKMIAIIYSSKYGTTEKICRTMASVIRDTDSVELIALENEPEQVDLSKYRTVILGTSIYAGKPRQSMVKFCEQYEAELLNKQLLLFVCGMDRGNAIKEIEASYPKGLLDHSLNNTFFEGEYHLDRMSFGDRILLRVFFKVKESKTRDYLDEAKMFVEIINTK